MQEVVPATNSWKAALAIAGRINKKSPLGRKGRQAAASKGMQKTLEKGLEIENEAFGMSAALKDKNEGVTAFLEKRKPNFHVNKTHPGSPDESSSCSSW